LGHECEHSVTHLTHVKHDAPMRLSYRAQTSFGIKSVKIFNKNTSSTAPNTEHCIYLCLPSVGKTLFVTNNFNVCSSVHSFVREMQ